MNMSRTTAEMMRRLRNALRADRTRTYEINHFCNNMKCRAYQDRVKDMRYRYCPRCREELNCIVRRLDIKK